MVILAPLHIGGRQMGNVVTGPVLSKAGDTLGSVCRHILLLRKETGGDFNWEMATECWS